jgi:hypothetical protein
MQLDKIKIANTIADAMIDKINSENLMKEFLEQFNDDFDGFSKTIISVFAMKLMPQLIKIAENEDDDFDEEDKEMIETMKSILNIKGDK